MSNQCHSYIDNNSLDIHTHTYVAMYKNSNKLRQLASYSSWYFTYFTETIITIKLMCQVNITCKCIKNYSYTYLVATGPFWMSIIAS